MEESTKQIIKDAQLIIDNHHQGFGESMVLDAYSIRQRALWMAGFTGMRHDEDTWDEHISKLPEEIRGVMIDMDDAMEMHRFC